MTNNYVELQENISEYVTNLFNQYHGDDLCYHNLEHTKNVVIRTIEIAANYQLSETELFILSASAWFHDTGQLVGGPKLHEDKSVIIMKDFLEPKSVKKDIIGKIESCVCATKMPQHPKTIMDEILCDADTYNLGTEDFLKTDELLKKEFTLRKIPVDNWEEKTLELLLTHKYFTPYCQKLLNQGRVKNIDLVRYRL